MSNEQLHLLPLKAAWETYGEMRARHMKSSQVFCQEVGEIPYSLQHLAIGWTSLRRLPR